MHKFSLICIHLSIPVWCNVSTIFFSSGYNFLPSRTQRDVQSSPASTKLLITTEPQKIDDLKKLTKREKLLICFIAFLIAILITLAVVIGVLHIKRSKSTSQTKTNQSALYPCITRDCVLTSSGNQNISYLYMG